MSNWHVQQYVTYSAYDDTLVTQTEGLINAVVIGSLFYYIGNIIGRESCSIISIKVRWYILYLEKQLQDFFAFQDI